MLVTAIAALAVGWGIDRRQMGAEIQRLKADLRQFQMSAAKDAGDLPTVSAPAPSPTKG